MIWKIDLLYIYNIQEIYIYIYVLIFEQVDIGVSPAKYGHISGKILNPNCLIVYHTVCPMENHHWCEIVSTEKQYSCRYELWAMIIKPSLRTWGIRNTPKWSFVENEVLNHKMDPRGIMKQTWEDRQQI